MKFLLLINILLFVIIESRLIPPKITQIGCNNDNKIVITSLESCNRIIRGVS